MRKAICVLFLLPLFVAAQEKNVLTYTRLFVKPDKVQQFEKALTAHAKKYHKGDWHWRVSTIESGPWAGGYNITEGPNTWEALDKRGDLGQEHMNDWDKSITPFLTERYEAGYLVYRPELSTAQLTQYSDKSFVIHNFFKPGYFDDMEAMIKNLKKGWEAGEQSVVVYEASASGPPQFIIVVRYKEGLKERATGYRKPMKERYESTNGSGSWVNYQTFLRSAINETWSELLYYKKELSSN